MQRSGVRCLLGGLWVRPSRGSGLQSYMQGVPSGPIDSSESETCLVSKSMLCVSDINSDYLFVRNFSFWLTGRVPQPVTADRPAEAVRPRPGGRVEAPDSQVAARRRLNSPSAGAQGWGFWGVLGGLGLRFSGFSGFGGKSLGVQGVSGARVWGFSGKGLGFWALGPRV